MNGRIRPDDPDALRETVREGYAELAQNVTAPGGGPLPYVAVISRAIGYSDAQLQAIPTGSNLGFGCGNPTAIDALRPGEVVVDLGSGAGVDAFLAARQVGPAGRVIGVDMTEVMLAKARDNARKGGYTNVEFRAGMIEQLPIESESVDVVLSNCVINLSPEKPRVFAEAYRVLKPGGRLMVSDLVLERGLPREVLQSVAAYLGCVGGASLRSDYLQCIELAGFQGVAVTSQKSGAEAFALDDPSVVEAMQHLRITPSQARQYMAAVTSLHVFARKPSD